MPLPPLASLDDLEARMFRDLTAEELARTEVMLNDASAVVRNYTRRLFTTMRETARLRPVGYRVRLPHRPVLDVHTVVLLVDTLRVTIPGFVWDGMDEVWLAPMGQVINLAETAYEWLATHTPVAEVDYTSGNAEVPADVVSVVCSMITRGLSAPGAGGLITEAVGEYSYRLSDAAAQGPLTLTESERAILSAYRVPGVAAELRM